MVANHSLEIPDSLDGLQEALHGTLLLPDDEGYDEARTLWNAMIDRRPKAIVRPAGPAGVITAVEFARESGMGLAVKGNGHNIAGSAMIDDGLVIDLAEMDSIRVDPDDAIAHVEPGAKLSDVDAETQAFGLAVPTGINSTTGISGLTLGGGWGWLSRVFGLTADNLRSADVVTADGELVHANAEENPDLFWGLRGGGGNFGIVTDFEFDLHPVGPEVLAGPIVHPGEDTRAVLDAIRAFNEDAPDEAAVWVVLRKAPPLPFLDERVHGTDVAIVVACYAGDVSEGEDVLRPVREIGDPHADALGPMRYTELQQLFDPLLVPGMRNYWKTHNFTGLADGTIDTLVASAPTVPTPHTEILVVHLGGAINRVPTDATAYPHRDVEYIVNIHTRWEDEGDDERCIEWVSDRFDALDPEAMGGAYVNFITEESGEEDRAYEENYARLVEVKDAWDPENVFRMNQNVEPSA